MENTSLKLLSAHCNCDRLAAVPACHWPEILSVHTGPETAEFKLNISGNLPWFDGHFPEQPVLPGVVQTHWAGLLASAVFDLANEFSAMTKIKFKTPVLPGQSLDLELVHVALRKQITYRYHEKGAEYSTGTLHFGGPAA